MKFDKNSNNYQKPFAEIVILEGESVILQGSIEDGFAFGNDLFDGGIF